MSDIKKYNQEVQYQNRSIQNNGKKSVGKDIFTKSDETLFSFLEESFVFGRSAVFENNETQNTDVDNVIDWEDDIVEKIREITGISSGDIRYSDVSNTQTFDLSDSTVKDISVLKNLSDLEYLNIAGCPIEDYSPIEGLHIDEVFK